jgi:hypothetical protein
MGGSVAAQQKAKTAETSSNKSVLQPETPVGRRQGEGGVEELLMLQRTAGNQAVLSLLQKPRSLTGSLDKENLDDAALTRETKAVQEWLKANPSDPDSAHLRSELDDLQLEQSGREEKMRPAVAKWTEYKKQLDQTSDVASTYNDYNSHDNKMRAVGKWSSYVTAEELR